MTGNNLSYLIENVFIKLKEVIFMKKKLVGVLLVAAMAVSTVAGCGGSSNDAAADSSNGAAEKTDATETGADASTAEEGDETLTVWCWDPTFNVYAMQQAEAMYQKDHPNFKLDIQEKVYTDIEQSLITAAESGNFDTLPDIFLMQDNSFSKNATNYPELFTDLTDSGIDFDQFSGGKLADSTVDGAHYGIPFDNGATIMAIRTDMVENAGLTVEDFKDTTWSEFMELAQKVVDANGVPMLTSSGGSEIVIEMFHLKAIEIISKSLRGAVENTKEGREGMALGQYIAGMGFSNVGLGIAHSMAHTLGAVYDTPHGVACAMMLPIVMEYNADCTGEKYREIARAMGVEGVDNMSQEEYRKAAVDAVRKLSEDVGIPSKLEALKEEDLQFLAESAHADACAPGNPKDASVEDLKDLFRKLM